MKTNQFAGIYEEFVRVLQGASSLYRFGSDRVNNAEHYTQKHASAMQAFSSKELHPDTCQLYRDMARRHLGVVDKDQAGQMACLDGQN